MPIRIPGNNHPVPVTPSPNRPVPVTPAPGPAPRPTGWTPQPPPAPAPGNTDLFGGGPQPPLQPTRLPVQLKASAEAILHAEDLPPIKEQFDHAATDGLITSGEVDQLIHSIAARPMSEDDAAQLKEAFSANASKLDPAAAARLQRFISGEVPKLRSVRDHNQALGVHTVVAAWNPPTTHSDGTPLTDLAGYKLHVGTQPGIWDQTIDIPDPGAAGYAIPGLTSGPKYLMVTAYDTHGVESGPSNQASAVVP